MTRAPRLVAGLAASALALTLGACSTLDRAQAAAVIDGRVISEDQVQVVSEQFATVTKNPVATRSIVEAMVAAPFAVDYMTSSGKWKPDTEYANLLAGFDNPAPETVELVKYIASARAMDAADQEAVRKTMAKAHIEVNPRYGQFATDAQAFGLQQVMPNWIKSTPTAAAH